VNAALFRVGKEEKLVLIKRVKLTHEFEEASQECTLLKIGPIGSKFWANKYFLSQLILCEKVWIRSKEASWSF